METETLTLLLSRVRIYFIIICREPILDLTFVRGLHEQIVRALYTTFL